MSSDSITGTNVTTCADGGLWTARQVSQFIKCSVSYVYKAAERDVLPSVRIGRMLRFRPEAIRAFIANVAAA